MNETNQAILQQVVALPSTYQQHWPALMLAAGAATHLAHLAWPSIKSAGNALKLAWPYLRDNGGVVGILKTFLFGKSSSAATPAAEQPTKTV